MAGTGTNSEPLSERAQALLKTLVENYIRDGQPVGSRTLSRDSGLKLSPATVRNVMADLEELGLVSSPHTSAGRIPTVKGYRCFIDTLLVVQPLERRQVQQLRSQLISAETAHSKDLITQASSLLSGLTHLAGIVTVPRQNHAALSQIEFIRLSPRRLLVVLVVDNREVENRIVHVDHDYSESELRYAANFLNQKFSGVALTDVRSKLIDEMHKTRDHLNQGMLEAIRLAHDAMEAPPARDGEFVVAGGSNLMGLADLDSVAKLRQLFEAFDEQRTILHLLDRSLTAEGVQIFIGEESGHELLNGCSVVTAPYTIDDEVVGVLGVIGPTRMAYERVISAVDVTSRLLTAALKN